MNTDHKDLECEVTPAGPVTFEVKFTLTISQIGSLLDAIRYFNKVLEGRTIGKIENALESALQNAGLESLTEM